MTDYTAVLCAEVICHAIKRGISVQQTAEDLTPLFTREEIFNAVKSIDGLLGTSRTVKAIR